MVFVMPRITDKRHDLQSKMSRSQGHMMRLIGVGSYIEKVKLVAKLPTPRDTTRTSFNVKGQRSRSPD